MNFIASATYDGPLVIAGTVCMSEPSRAAIAFKVSAFVDHDLKRFLSPFAVGSAFIVPHTLKIG